MTHPCRHGPPDGPSLHVVIDALLAAILAPQCVACLDTLDRPTSGPVCAACWASVEAAPTPLPPAHSLALDAFRAAGHYQGTLRSIIRAFKYEGRRSLSTPLGRLVRVVGAPELVGATCVVPVPLHPWRRLRRGFNQAEDLARTLGLPVLPALRRTRWTASQTGLPAADRRRNVRGAFDCSSVVSSTTRRAWLANRTVVLIDDVSTTGATLDACARVLKHAGAARVRALTVAWAPPSHAID